MNSNYSFDKEALKEFGEIFRAKLHSLLNSKNMLKPNTKREQKHLINVKRLNPNRIIYYNALDHPKNSGWVSDKAKDLYGFHFDAIVYRLKLPKYAKKV